jgi:hypothetical protein
MMTKLPEWAFEQGQITKIRFQAAAEANLFK